mgnify:CR=1 FL=1
MALKILLAEDEEALSQVYKAALEHQGYEVDQAFNGQEAVDLAAQNAYQVMIMDIMMPIKTGIEALKEIRSSGDRTHVIMLTAMAEIDDRVTGLDAGADDYVTKPFGMMELVSRIKAVLRRTQKDTQDPQDVIVLGDIEMNTKKHEVTADGEVVTLTLKEYELLKRLMKNPNIVMTRDCLLEDIWGYDFDGETRTVDVHVRTLRQKLGKSGEKIETVRGVGYRMSE